MGGSTGRCPASRRRRASMHRRPASAPHPARVAHPETGSVVRGDAASRPVNAGRTASVGSAPRVGIVIGAYSKPPVGLATVNRSADGVGDLPWGRLHIRLRSTGGDGRPAVGRNEGQSAPRLPPDPAPHGGLEHGRRDCCRSAANCRRLRAETRSVERCPPTGRASR